MTALLVNGEPAAALDPRDRGLHYGDGLFETMAVIDGRPRLWPYHFERLTSGCNRLGLPGPDGDTLLREIGAVAAGMPRAVVKVILTRGVGGRGYRPPAVPQPTRLVGAHPWPDYPAQWREEGVAVRLCRTPLGASPALAGLKSLNRLEQVLARAEWDDPQVPEGLMRDAAGHIVCGTQSNLFVVEKGRLHTPDLSHGGIEGVMRRRVLELARAEGLEAVIEPIGLERVQGADELFLTNALIGLWPVRRLESRALAVGPLTSRLSRLLAGEGI